MRLMDLKPMESKRDSERDAERDSQDFGGDGAAKVVQLYEAEAIDAGLAAHVAWIKEQPEENRRLHLANLAAGVGAQSIAEIVAGAMVEMEPAERTKVALFLCNRLSDTERADVLIQAKYDMPAAKAAFKKATPKVRREILEDLSSVQKVKQRSKRRAEASRMERQLSAIDTLLRQAVNDIAAGRVFSEQEWMRVEHEVSSAVLGFIRHLQDASSSGRSDVLALHDRKHLAWQNAPTSERRVWRECETKANDPEIIAINEQAKGDRPVRPAAVKSQLGRFVK